MSSNVDHSFAIGTNQSQRSVRFLGRVIRDDLELVRLPQIPLLRLVNPLGRLSGLPRNEDYTF
jgi:hypothetical protein